ncbi:MAG: HAD family hydrolase [Kiritimatiellae bacterium]|nr:HAD family hydrolase [Kiritimatiellia bacterium]
MNNPSAHEKPAVFLDRDGTLNQMVYDETHGIMDSPRRPEQLRLLPGAAELIRRLRTLHFEIIVVTNQPGIAKGTLTEEELDAVNARLAELLREEDAAWDALEFCPHHPSEGTRADLVGPCDCRKPKPGMMLKAARERGLSLRESWMIGDGLVDIQAGQAAGCRTILLTKLKIEQIERFIRLDAIPDHIAPSLSNAADHISNHWKRPAGLL